eukprot:8085433-Pyramimonas_sp.AAC.1
MQSSSVSVSCGRDHDARDDLRTRNNSKRSHVGTLKERVITMDARQGVESDGMGASEEFEVCMGAVRRKGVVVKR